MEVTDHRHTDLYVSAATFLTHYALHPDPAGYLAHGYVDLCLAAWPTASGVELDLATRWALWTWIVDDAFDTDMLDESRQAVGEFALSLLLVACGSTQPGAADHPTLRALADLAADTQALMPAFWWQRYLTHLEDWVHAASTKLLDFVQPRRTPTLREYLTIRPPDGGMLLAAMWTELAERVVTPDWHDPLVQSLLRAFSTVGCLTNDLADSGDPFGPVCALVAAESLGPVAARELVAEQLLAEQQRFWWLYSAVRSGGFTSADTSRFALALDRFRHALADWTADSSRYQPPEVRIMREQHAPA